MSFSSMPRLLHTLARTSRCRGTVGNSATSFSSSSNARRKSSSAAVKSPISRLTQPRASTASASSLRISACSASAVCARSSSAMAWSKTGLACANCPLSRSRSAWLFRVWPRRRRSSVVAAGSFWASASSLLRRECLIVKDVRLPGVGAAADQEVGQQGAGPGQRPASPRARQPAAPASGSSNVQRAAIRLLGIGQPAELALDVAHLLVGPAVLQLDRGVVGGPAGELLVIGQGLFQELLLERVELLVEADVGDLGQAGGRPARACWPWASASFRSRAISTVLTARAMVAVDEQPGGGGDRDLVPPRPPQHASWSRARR